MSVRARPPSHPRQVTLQQVLPARAEGLRSLLVRTASPLQLDHVAPLRRGVLPELVALGHPAQRRDDQAHHSQHRDENEEP